MGAAARGNVGAEIGVEDDLRVCLAFGLSDGVAVTLVAGVEVGLDVAALGSTVSNLA